MKRFSARRLIGVDMTIAISSRPAARALWRCLISQDLVGEADQVQGEYGMLLKDVEDKMQMEALTMISNSSRDVVPMQPAMGAHSRN